MDSAIMTLEKADTRQQNQIGMFVIQGDPGL